MSAVAALVARNADVVRTGSHGGLPALPGLGLVVVGCADTRADPTQVLALRPGEAAVVRNAGGRVTPDLLRTLTIMALAVAGEASPRPLELLLLHHTDCGVSRSAHHRDLMASYFGTTPDGLDAKSLTDPDLAVRADLLALQESGLVPPDLVVSALVLDVRTGGVRPVVAPTRLGDLPPLAATPHGA